MENQIKVPLSKKTETLRSDCRKLIDELKDVRPAAAKILESDKGDAVELSGKLGHLRAQEELLTVRLARRRKELFAAVFADAQANVEAANAEVKRATDAWRLQREAWQMAVFEAHPKAAAQRIANDESLSPNGVRDARLTLDEARQYQADALRVLSGMNQPAWKVRRATAATPVGGWVTPDFIGNAAKLAPELKD